MKNTNFKYGVGILSVLVANTFPSSMLSAKTPTKPNILFICIDDLRRDLGCYGSPILSPNMDKLANQGNLFFHQYVQIPTSGASRASMLTGKYPVNRTWLSNEAAVLNLSNKKEAATPETFIAELKRQGYFTSGIGKISHRADGLLYESPTGKRTGKRELPFSWSELNFDYGTKWQNNGWRCFFACSDGDRYSKHFQITPYEKAPVNDDGLPDGLTANLAVQKLKELSKRKQPFCLSVGFFKPHLPFNAPKKYWDLYDHDKIVLSPVKDYKGNISSDDFTSSGEFNQYKGLVGSNIEFGCLDTSVSDDYARTLRQAYYACVSYTDAQVGKVLNELHELGLDKNTLVVLWGDHGWHLGDYRVWGKHTLMETSLVSAFMIKGPGITKGIKNHHIVSAIDIYPTIMDYCGLDMNYGKGNEVEGTSLMPLISSNPVVSAKAKDWVDCAYSYWNHGVSVRTPQYRLTRYKIKDGWRTELFNLGNERFERVNVADKFPEVVNEMMVLWNKSNYNFY